MSAERRRECSISSQGWKAEWWAAQVCIRKLTSGPHVAEYGIFIRDGYRNLGLGTQLTTTFIDIAKERGIEIAQVSVYATDQRAFHVYKKCGYKESGRLARDVKFLDGTYTDRILMELPLQ